ncbi:uncharacterized protein J3D65DRAFT_695587 [Phyllosticta citribraziliensis]|uniref:BTB domain-containing protein n=1 Tax=Phyllosticta citribraziliensis TaxID=989973 RepID=A0ABR1LNQ5_9PEZI
MEDSPAHSQCVCSPAWASYFENERHADVSIVCRDGRAIKAHKLVLSLGSPYFEKALNPAHNFKESQSNEVHLHDEDPAVVKAVLQFIYTRDYACASSSVSSPCPTNESTTHTDDHNDDDVDDELAAELIFHAAMHAAAGYFLMPALADIAFTRFEALATADWPRTAAALPAVIAFVYDNSPSSPTSPLPSSSPSPPASASASPSPPPSTTPFPIPSPTPSAPSPSSPHRLRTLLTTLCAPNLSSLTSNPAFNAMMDAVGAFGRELAALLAKRNQALKQEFGGRRFLCTYCVERYCVQSDGCEGLHTPNTPRANERSLLAYWLAEASGSCTRDIVRRPGFGNAAFLQQSGTDFGREVALARQAKASRETPGDPDPGGWMDSFESDAQNGVSAVTVSPSTTWWSTSSIVEALWSLADCLSLSFRALEPGWTSPFSLIRERQKQRHYHLYHARLLEDTAELDGFSWDIYTVDVETKKGLEDLAEAINIINSTTPDPVRTLRDIAVELCAPRIKVLSKSKAFMDAVYGCGLWDDVAVFEGGKDDPSQDPSSHWTSSLNNQTRSLLHWSLRTAA